MKTELQENQNNIAVKIQTEQWSGFNGPSKSTVRKKTVLFWFLIILGVILTVFIFYILVLDNPENNTVLHREPEFVITLENTKEMFNQQSKIVFPEITGREDVDIAELGDDLAELNYKGASRVRVKKLTYANGNVGFEMNFLAPNPLQDFYFDMSGKLKAARWQNLFSSRAILAAVIEVKKNNTKLKIIASKNSDGLTEVYAQSIIGD